MRETLLIHGWGFKADSMRGILLLQQVKTIDLYALSESLSFDESIDLIAKNINGTVNIVAWSLGGAYAMTLALQYPDKVNKLLMFTSTPCFIQKENWSGFSEQQMVELETLIDKDVSKALTTFAGWCSKGHVSVKDALKQAKANLAYNIDKVLLLKLLAVLKGFDNREQFKNISRPTKFVIASEDNIVSQQQSFYQSEQNENIETETIEQTGHLLPFGLSQEQKDEYVAWLQAS